MSATSVGVTWCILFELLCCCACPGCGGDSLVIFSCFSLLHAFAMCPNFLRLLLLVDLNLHIEASCPVPRHQALFKLFFIVGCLVLNLEAIAFTSHGFCCPVVWISQAFFAAVSIAWVISKAFLRDKSVSPSNLRCIASSLSPQTNLSHNASSRNSPNSL